MARTKGSGSHSSQPQYFQTSIKHGSSNTNRTLTQPIPRPRPRRRHRRPSLKPSNSQASIATKASTVSVASTESESTLNSAEAAPPSPSKPVLIQQSILKFYAKAHPEPPEFSRSRPTWNCWGDEEYEVYFVSKHISNWMNSCARSKPPCGPTSEELKAFNTYIRREVVEEGNLKKVEDLMGHVPQQYEWYVCEWTKSPVARREWKDAVDEMNENWKQSIEDFGNPLFKEWTLRARWGNDLKEFNSRMNIENDPAGELVY